MKPNVPNVIYRIQARMAIARNRGTIMLIALLSTLFLLLSQAFLQMGMNRDANALITLLSGVSDGSLTNAGLVTLTDRILREKNIPLFAVETQRPVKDFDFLLITGENHVHTEFILCLTRRLDDLCGRVVAAKCVNDNFHRITSL